MVFASADFSCFFVQIFFYAHVIGAKREYVALFFFVGQCFQLFGIGKTRNGIGHRFTVFLQFAKFEIYFFVVRALLPWAQLLDRSRFCKVWISRFWQAV